MSQVYRASGAWKRRFLPFLVILVAIFGFLAYNNGWIKGRRLNKVETVKLDQMAGEYKKDAVTYAVPKTPLPSGDEVDEKTFATVAIYDWHANTALPYANGGERTLTGSLLGKEGVVMRLKHQDDTNVSIKEFLDKAAEFKKSGGTSGGNFMFTIMGNGSVPLIEPIQASLRDIDPAYKAVAIDLIGKSDGEDQFIGPKEWKTNPEAMRGKIVTGVYDDGDVQLSVMYADKVGIPVNFDYHTYNPHALNIEAVSDFITAGKAFIAGGELDPRPVIDDNGRRTGKTTKDLGLALHRDSLASWTPVDRNLVKQLAMRDPERFKSLATIVSTGGGEERKVMPCTLIALNKWVDQSQDKLAKLSYAVHRAAMEVEKYPDALQKAMEINTALLGVWDDGGDAKTAATERLKAFQGYFATENPELHIGGSTVFSFKDAMNMLGASGDSMDLANSTFASVYRSFGNLTVRKYPEKNLKSYTPFEQFFDPRVLRAAYSRAKAENLGSSEIVAQRQYDNAVPTPVLGSTNFQITFRTGSAEFDNSALQTLQEIQDEYAASEFPITVIGHTDRTGSDAVNQPLSERRAAAVRDYLIARNSRDFGGSRIQAAGKGSSEPPAGIDPNYTGNCNTCRRVEIQIHK